MPNRWLHETIDIITFGRSYWELHKEKDSPSKELGWRHRELHHEWYQCYGSTWDFDDPFPPPLMLFLGKVRMQEGPGQGEKYQSSVSHDYIDRWWDTLSNEERKNVAEKLKGILNNHVILKRWAGIDVLEGKVLITDERDDGNIERWEYEPGLKRDYGNLIEFINSNNIEELV